ncbi:PilN domain-containing protein [Candidatus Symbiopectobacterium sp. NZEC135]|uniref:PilN domain-containing protein n=1 Tax=Candidatus Symbiopectobacterium sp. NZEC135 TaxID=2820471 RepID=UPI002225EEA0|nr:PilN domain-containing protein [Candidatus Symbiopectobacterium sp. NZEC135]MCW2479299.1 PilN domain-containing protein [Candidatus Symbiopectobacterium sp. NZEC135]
MHTFRVNLLPWRQRRWVRDTRRWWLRLLFFLGGLLIALAVCRGRLDQQRGAMAEMQRTLQQKHLADSAQLREVQRLMVALQQWHVQQQADNKTRAHNRGYEQLLKQLAQCVPEGLWLTAITVQDGKAHLTGRSHDYADIVHFSSRLETETALTSMRLMQTRQEIMASPEGDVPVLTFHLQADWLVGQVSLQDVSHDE